MPKDAPTFGDRVLIRDIEGEQKSFAPRAKEGIFLHWTMAVTHGAAIAVLTGPPTTEDRDRPSVKIVTASGPKKWPEKMRSWRVEQDDRDLTKRVWVSSDGMMRWGAPDEDAVLTFEERSLPSGGDVLEIMKMLEATAEKDWRVFRHGTPTIESKKFNEEIEEEQDDKVDDEDGVRKCAMNVDEFQVETCVDCQKEVEHKDAWWYHGKSYCEKCYHSYLTEDRSGVVEMYQANITSGRDGDDRDELEVEEQNEYFCEQGECEICGDAATQSCAYCSSGICDWCSNRVG